MRRRASLALARSSVSLPVRYHWNCPNRRAGHASIGTYGQTFDARLEEVPRRRLYQDVPREGDSVIKDWREVPKMLDHLGPGERG
jgi:hypothetical protein